MQKDLKRINMIPTFTYAGCIQYTLTNPDFIFNQGNSGCLKIKMRNNIGDVLFDGIATIKSKLDWRDTGKWRYHLCAPGVNIYVVTDDDEKVKCMSVDYDCGLEFKIDDRKTKYSTKMSVVRV